MANFRDWVEEYFEVETVDGTDYVIVYEEENDYRTIEYDIAYGDLYSLIGDAVETADDVGRVSREDIHAQLDPSWGYEKIIEEWQRQQIIR